MIKFNISINSKLEYFNLVKTFFHSISKKIIYCERKQFYLCKNFQKNSVSLLEYVKVKIKVPDPLTVYFKIVLKHAY